VAILYHEKIDYDDAGEWNMVIYKMIGMTSLFTRAYAAEVSNLQ
jgi:hypothetical protein